ncbi:filamentous hemagglutinin family outer membrane protein [Richelia sinica FACHB-800]|uniref:Filamentous hemagglutinin family outer membrane protein n=1 Tax=Richelia sinica FACHB-800 TaxID=1357546 RepID=A0A975Y2Y0_9NOST|nr:filamentous hemagglutinin family outer membrane protein [Richelia sinica FACHB-800]
MTLTAGGDISTQDLNSYSFSDSGTAGNGGEMAFRAGGNISTLSLNSSSFSDSGTAGNGGAMTLTAGGDISTQDLNSYSLSFSGTGGNGSGDDSHCWWGYFHSRPKLLLIFKERNSRKWWGDDFDCRWRD